MAAKGITLHVMGKRRTLTVAERIAFAPTNRSSREVLWPVAVPEYGKTKDAAERRKRNYWDAVNAADALTDRIANALATGTPLHVNVWPGAVLTSLREEGIFANVVSPDTLRELCEVAESVTVAADSEDPRDYIGHDDDSE